MDPVIKVLNVYKSTLGIILILASSEHIDLRPGMKIKNQFGLCWTVSFVVGDLKKSIDNKYKNLSVESVWDCIVNGINHTESLKVGDVLFLST